MVLYTSIDPHGKHLGASTSSTRSFRRWTTLWMEPLAPLRQRSYWYQKLHMRKWHRLAYLLLQPLKKTHLPKEVPGASVDIYSIYFGQIMWLETTCLFELWSAAQRVNAVQKGICLLHEGVHCRNSAKNWVSRCTSHGARICLMMVTSYREDPCLF